VPAEYDIKPMVKGGLNAVKKIAAIAGAAGVGIGPGTSSPTGMGAAAARSPLARASRPAAALDTLVEDVIAKPIPPDSTIVKIPSARPRRGTR
jgi:L-alanine-DL-glutamate epimerase-like enolase superfamily enzyme